MRSLTPPTAVLQLGLYVLPQNVPQCPHIIHETLVHAARGTQLNRRTHSVSLMSDDEPTMITH